MTAIDFPDSPTVGQLFTVGDVTWEWTGSVWQGLGTPTPGPEGPGVAAGGTAGQLLAKVDSTDYNTAWVTQEGYRIAQTLYYTSSGTFTKATYPWLRAIRVKCQGAGGGGGGARLSTGSDVSAGGGGAGGGCAESFITNIAGLDASVTVTRGGGGAGGSGDAAGSAGGNSSFGDAVIGNGGGGGARVSRVALMQSVDGGNGGGGTGDVVFVGSGAGAGLACFISGQTNSGSTGVTGGNGGGSFLGGGARSRSSAGGGAGGGLYGGGGSGACANIFNTTVDFAGGNGANGIVIVELYA
jgi:hypothetical protein